MKTKKINYSVLIVCALSFWFIAQDIYKSNFGRYVGGVSHPTAQLIPLIAPVLFLTFIPMSDRKIRKAFWNKSGIISIISVLLIILILFLIMKGNEVYYRDLWYKEQYTWDNCPPIRWDFWNILF